MHELTDKIWGYKEMAGVHVSRSWVNKCLVDWLAKKSEELKRLSVGCIRADHVRINDKIDGVLGLAEGKVHDKTCAFYTYGLCNCENIKPEPKKVSCEWPCEHIKFKKNDSSVQGNWSLNDIGGTFVDHALNYRLAKWNLCPWCGANRPLALPKPIIETLEEKFSEWLSQDYINYLRIDVHSKKLAQIAEQHFKDSK